MDDGFSTANPRSAINPLSQTGNAAIVGNIIDTQGYGEVLFLIATGAIVTGGAAFAVLLEDGNNSGLSDNATVVAGLQGTAALAGFAGTNTNSCYKIGYRPEALLPPHDHAHGNTGAAILGRSRSCSGRRTATPTCRFRSGGFRT